ncbi:MAG: HEAT repeat domain-containing protein [Planctomycetota bacterium]|nr:HEAT repeat domain-containing protein [Planctomycetota bacterium]
MDENIRALERQLEGDPVNREMLIQLSRLYERMGRDFFGKTLNEWIQQLSSHSWKNVLLAAVAFKRIGPLACVAADPLVKVLERRLANSEEHEFEFDEQGIHVETALIEALQIVDGHSPAGLRVLVLLLENEYDFEGEARIAAALALGAWGVGAEGAIPSLLDALEDHDWELQVAAAKTLGQLGPLSKEVIPGLIRALDDDDTDVCRAAIEALGLFSEEHEEAFSALIRFLNQTEDWEAQRDIIRCLGKLGAKAKRAVPALTAQLQDDDCDIQNAAAKALMLIGKPSRTAIPVLKQRLDDEDDETWRIMADAILKIQSAGA